VGGASPLRVLHLCAGNLYGGVERIVAECAASRSLAADMEPRFAVCFDGRLAAELDGSGAPCDRLGPARLRAPWSVARARGALSRLIERDRPQVLVGHSAWAYALGAPVARRAGIAPVLWLHDRLSGRTLVERWAHRHAPNLVICNSRFTEGSVPRLFPDARAAVVYAPVAAGCSAVEDRSRLRQALGVADDRPVVLIASRFEAWKGHRELLAALAGIEAPWELWIAGRPQRRGEEAYVRRLREQADAVGPGRRVRFLGERTDVAALMRAADIHCQPNNQPEPFGLAFVEALYAGLPVVTTGIGGPLEIVTPACGILVPPGAPSALRAALVRLMEDPGERRRLGAAGPARAAMLCDPGSQLQALAAALRLAADS